MSPPQLRAFVAAAETGSFTAAGMELGLAQASVSELVRRLEEDYGLVLFSRGGRRLTLTGAGRLLLPVAEQALAALTHADETLRAFRGLRGGSATFGVMRNAEYYLLADLAATFHQRYPDVEVRLIGQNSVEVAAAVSSGELEAGLVVLPVDDEGLDVRPLLHDEVVVVTAVPQRWGATVDAAALAQAPLVLYDAHYGWRDPTRRQVLALARGLGVTLHPIVEVEHITSALRLVARGIGDTFVSRAVTTATDFPPALHVVPFSPPMHDTVASITRDAGILSPATRALLELAEQMLLARST